MTRRGDVNTDEQAERQATKERCGNKLACGGTYAQACSDALWRGLRTRLSLRTYTMCGRFLPLVELPTLSKSGKRVRNSCSAQLVYILQPLNSGSGRETGPQGLNARLAAAAPLLLPAAAMACCCSARACMHVQCVRRAHAWMMSEVCTSTIIVRARAAPYPPTRAGHGAPYYAMHAARRRARSRGLYLRCFTTHVP